MKYWRHYTTHSWCVLHLIVEEQSPKYRAIAGEGDDYNT